MSRSGRFIMVSGGSYFNSNTGVWEFEAELSLKSNLSAGCVR